MLANAPHSFTHPLPPHQPPHETELLLHHDPFQSLYDSLANLTLTSASTATSSTTTTTTTSAFNPPSFTPTPNPPLTPSSQTTQSHQQLISILPLFPPGDNVIFAHSTFFGRRPTFPSLIPDLPTPAQVRDEAARLGIINNNNNNNDNDGGSSSGSAAKLVPFPSLGLLVKYGVEGSGVSAAEGKAMMLMRPAVLSPAAGGGVMPVPEVFGWRRDGGTGERFVYLDLPEGDVLEQRWEGMAEAEREAVCTQLRGWVAEWRRLRVGGVGFVGSVDNGPLQDEVFRGCTMAGAPPPGPFPTVATFHDYFVSMAATISQSRHAGAAGGQLRYTPQHLFPDDVPVVFTHGGLHPRNIVVSAGPNPRVVSILGWEQAGWYPAYWELCKARWECSRRGSLGDWESKYLPGVLDAEGLNAEMRGWHVGALCQYWDYFVGLM